MAESLKSHVQDEALLKNRRRQIFEAACRVLARKSFHEATVKEIADEARIAAGSIYVYLQSKDDILFLIAESMVAELSEMLPAIRERTESDPQRELLEVMRAVLDVIDRYRAAYAVLHHEARYLVARREYRQTLGPVFDRYTSAVSDVLKRGKSAGVLRFENLRSVVEAVHMLCSGWAMGAGYLKEVDKESYWREISALVQGRFFLLRNDGARAAAGR
jgi:TetR/AcrR family fatty acid metabolism transcriptional regulator